MAEHPQSPDGARMVREAIGGEAGRIWWVMCATGMMPDEFYGVKYSVEDGYLHIKGTKSPTGRVRARDRFVPLIVTIDDLAPGRLSYWGLLNALRRSGLGVRSYDGRRTFAKWLREAGIQKVFREMYQGHGPQTMTELYEWPELWEHLEEHTAALKAYVGGRTKGRTRGGRKRVSPSGPTRNRTENLLIKSRARGATVRQGAPGPATSRHSRSDRVPKGGARTSFPDGPHRLSPLRMTDRSTGLRAVVASHIRTCIFSYG